MSKIMNYYTAESARGSSTSMGFSNDTVVKVFSGKASRDAYLAASSNISAVKIRACQATSHAANISLNGNGNGKPRPFTEEFWGLVDYGSEFLHGNEAPEGFIGTLEVCGNGNIPEPYVIRRFY